LSDKVSSTNFVAFVGRPKLKPLTSCHTLAAQGTAIALMNPANLNSFHVPTSLDYSLVATKKKMLRVKRFNEFSFHYGTIL